jgi:hypothetical protein
LSDLGHFAEVIWGGDAMDWPLMTGSVAEMMDAYERQWQREMEAYYAPPEQTTWDKTDREDL